MSYRQALTNSFHLQIAPVVNIWNKNFLDILVVLLVLFSYVLVSTQRVMIYLAKAANDESVIICYIILFEVRREREKRNFFAF